MFTAWKTSISAAGILLCTTVLLGGCGDETTIPEPEPDVKLWEEIASDLPREMSPQIAPEDYEELAAGNHEFALALLSELDPAGNLLFSPLSIRTAFAMVYAGAQGQTAVEMEGALHYGLAQPRLHPAWNGLDLALADRNDIGDEDNPPVELYLTNSVWGRLGYPFEEDYLDLLAVNYGAGIYEIDFFGAPDASRLAINEWVAEQTREKILDLLPENSISISTAIVLTNALYFRAPWSQPFDPDSTATVDFHLLDGGTIPVQMLHKLDHMGYTEVTGCAAVEIPFRGEDLSMVILLPDAGKFGSFTAGLDVATLDEILAGLATAGVEFGLPKFSFEFKCQLKSILQGFGMELSFTPSADFGGMTQNDLLWIDEAYHKTFIRVDEKGTEAAAATAITMVDVGMPVAEYTFLADRPFLLLIMDRPTQTILFLGRVVEPAE